MFLKFQFLQKKNRFDDSDFPLPFGVKLRPHEGQLDAYLCIAKPQSGQTRFTCKCVIIRDISIIPKKMRMRNRTSPTPICICVLKTISKAVVTYYFFTKLRSVVRFFLCIVFICGVSIMSGVSSKRGSLRIYSNAVVPIFPSPICSCLSTRL